MPEQRLWAPWRLEYIKGPKPDECIFCSKPALGDDAEAHIVHRGELVFSMLNAYPYNNGHLMIAPYSHVASIEELDRPVLFEMMTETQAALSALRGAYSPDGFNVGVNQGKVAGAGIESHLHLHVVPRWDGDSNFMPVTGDTRVLPETLDQSYEAISATWA